MTNEYYRKLTSNFGICSNVLWMTTGIDRSKCNRSKCSLSSWILCLHNNTAYRNHCSNVTSRMAGLHSLYPGHCNLHLVGGCYFAFFYSLNFITLVAYVNMNYIIKWCVLFNCSNITSLQHENWHV